MTTITSSTPIRNGIDTSQVYGTLDVLPGLSPRHARFEFRVRNNWIDGTHSRVDDPRASGAPAPEDVSRPRAFIRRRQ